MDLEFKRDFTGTAARWDAFWRGELGRPMICATIPKPGVTPVDKPPYASAAAGNFGPVIDQLLGWAQTHEFLGDAIPFYYLEFAATHFSALLGVDLVFKEGQTGGWPVPFVTDWDDVEIRFRPDSKWWGMTVDFAQALQDRCQGAIMIASPTLVANLDALVALRGAQNLLLDLVLRPDAVHRALDQVTRAHKDILDALAELLDYETWGSINRHGMYSSGRINIPQCDFSCMIGPDMFAEFVVPYLRREFDHFDAGEYHLDGPGAIKHLPALCEIEKLDIIQWVPGAGEAETLDWTWLYERIDELGKGQTRGGTCDDLSRLWHQINSQKLVWGLGARSRDEVDRCIESFG